MENLLRKRFGEYTDEIIEYMKNNDIIISGSFALQAYLNEEWEYSDVDFYIENNNYYHNSNVFLSEIDEKIERFVDIFKRIYNNFDKYHQKLGYDLVSNYYSFYKKERRNNRIFLTQEVDILIVKNYINTLKVFDFSFNKIYWNPNTGFVLINPANKNLIKNKIGYLENVKEGRLTKTLKRYNKYKERGFNIYNLNKELLKKNYKNYLYNNYLSIENKLIKNKKEFYNLVKNYVFIYYIDKNGIFYRKPNYNLLNNANVFYSIQNNKLYISIFNIYNNQKRLKRNIIYKNSIFNIECKYNWCDYIIKLNKEFFNSKLLHYYY